MDKCMFCERPISGGQATVTLTAKGCNGIETASAERGDNIQVVPGQVVHVNCRREYVNPNAIKRDLKRKHSVSPSETESPQCALRSSEEAFNYKANCLFCGCPDIYEGRKVEYKLIPVRTLGFQEKILKACEDFSGNWVDKVRARVLYVKDLPAADAVYHKICNINFRTGKDLPQIMLSQSHTAPKCKRLSGRPKDLVREEVFLKVTDYLEENDDEQITVTDLIGKMAEYIQDESVDPYSFKHMKTELKKHFGERIVISELNGKPNVVTFRTTVAKIVQDFHCQQQKSTLSETDQIIETAAKLIKNDIKDVKITKDMYPAYDSMSSSDKALQFLPESLLKFLQLLFPGKDVAVKLASIGQAIMQATRPRVLHSPLQIGLGVQLHHHFQSKFLIDSLHEHGFCCSYAEVKKFERSAAVMHGTEIPNLTSDSFLQYAADNVDHNVRSIDGKNTFHGMGIIAAITPATNVTRPIIRRADVTSQEIATVGRINIHRFTSGTESLHSMCYEPLQPPCVEEPYTDFDLLWKVSLLLKVSRPLWSGFMQMVHKGDNPGKASVMFLPMIDLDPNDMSCIFSTLKFVSKHASKYNCTAVITFDQPLWWKANLIVESAPADSELHSVIVRLGGFHTQMSFLGSIGHIMGGTGLQELLGVVYADNAVGHMLSGKAASRAVRGHLLTDAALNTMLAAKALSIDVQQGDPEQDIPQQYPEQDDPHDIPADGGNAAEENSLIVGEEADSVNLQGLANFIEKLLAGEVSDIDAQSMDTLTEIGERIQQEKNNLQKLETARLWLQYMEMVDILRQFLKAERIGDWALHLQSLHDMLPYLAASGHNLYLKSVHIYLQKMSKLKEQNQEVYKHFSEGLHVVRRSDRPWAGLSTDLVIEQCLMRSIKTTGGLTRGRGLTETQRLVWVLSTPACAEINSSMQELTGVTYTTSEQHKEATSARLARDTNDTKQLLRYLAQRNPFSMDPALRNIATGVTAHKNVNVQHAKDAGEQILASMEGQKVTDYTFKRSLQAVTMDAKASVKIRDEEVHVDPQLLFQRLVTAGVRCNDLSEVFMYELCTYPPALFESKYSMRPANKATLANALWSPQLESVIGPQDQVKYVLDGGALLHRIPWSMGLTWDELCSLYMQYVTSRYGKCVVVFDGYSNNPSTKDCTHLRRSGGGAGVAVHFTGDMTLQMKKDEFLCNKENKQRFIHLLTDKLEQSGCEVHQAHGDADVLIVKTTVACAEKQDTILIGDDTDLLVLLCFHAKETRYNAFFRPEPRKQSRRSRCWNIKATRAWLGDIVCNNILFIHAILGCDTTSRVFGIGKSVALTKIRKELHFLEQAQVFMSSTSSKEEVIKAGEQALVCLYNGEVGEDVDKLRLRRFYDKTMSSTATVQPHTLPPTASATKYHSLRVYHQIHMWKDERPDILAEQWGWKVSNGKMMPILTDLPPAPQALLEFIRCKCRAGCHTMRCICRKNGMDCSMACTECRGVCSNTPVSGSDSDDDPVME